MAVVEVAVMVVAAEVAGAVEAEIMVVAAVAGIGTKAVIETTHSEYALGESGRSFRPL